MRDPSRNPVLTPAWLQRLFYEQREARMSRSVWVDAGNDAQDKLKQLGITDPYFDGRWLAAKGPSAARAYLQGVQTKFGGAGIYLCSQGKDWPSHSTLTGYEWADWAYDIVQKKIAPGTSGAFPKVDFNNETDDIVWVVDMLSRWRARSPKRVTAWSPPAHKAAIFADVAADLVALNVTVRPQCYVDFPGDPMTRVESASELLAWASIGIPLERIEPFLDAQALGAWWYGCAFTQGGLPA